MHIELQKVKLQYQKIMREKVTEDNTTAIEKITNPVSKIAESLEKILDKLSGLSNINNPSPAQTIKDGVSNAVQNFSKDGKDYTTTKSGIIIPRQGLAKGGINTSGKAFHSVVSSGEIVNGGVVPPGGPYVTTIPKEDT